MKYIGILSLLFLCISLSAQDPAPLAPGTPVVREIAGGQTHAYRLSLRAGQLVRLLADQRTTNLSLALADASGKTLVEADLSLYGSLESLTFEAPGDGEYRVSVKALQPTGLTGPYELRVEIRNAATPADKTRIEAERLLHDGRKLRGAAAMEKLEQAAARFRTLNDEYWLSRTQSLYADYARMVGQYDPAMNATEEALRLSRNQQDRAGEAGAIRVKGILLSMRGQNAAARDLFEQDLAIRLATNDRMGQARSYSDLGISAMQTSQFDKALDYYDKAIAIYHDVKDTSNERFPLHNSADVLKLQGKFALAIERFNQAIAGHRAANDPVGEAGSLDSLGYTYVYQGDYDKGAEYIEKALAIRREVKDRNGEANSLVGLAGIAAQRGQHEKSIAYAEQALPIAAALRSLRLEADARLNLANAYFGLSQFDKAQECAEAAMALYQKMGGRNGEALALGVLANVHTVLGRYEASLEAYQKALDIHRTIKARTFESSDLIDMGITYTYLGQHEKAIEILEQGLALRRELKMTNAIDYVLNNLGNVYRKMGNLERAIQYYEEALPLLRKRNDPGSEAATLCNLANCHFFLNSYEKSREYAAQALPMAQTSKNRAQEGRVLHALGNALRGLGRLSESEAALRESIVVTREVRSRIDEAAAHTDLARLLAKKDDLKGALAEAQEGVRLHEAMRAEMIGADNRTSFFVATRDAYELVIELLQRLETLSPGQGYVTRALETSERARARSLLDLLTEMRVDIRRGVDTKLLDRERLLASQINAKAEALQQEKSANKITEIEQELSRLDTAYQLTQAEIRKASPAYAALTQPQPLAIAALQAQLDPDTMLLEYSIGAYHSYLWTLTRDSVKSYPLPPRKEIEQAARRLHELLAERGRAPRGETPAQRNVRIARVEKELPGAARALSQLALGPLAGTLRAQRLVIASDGALQYIPFGVLPAPAGKGAARAASVEDRPLLADHEIVMLPSLSALAAQRSELAARPAPAREIAIIADPIFSETDPRVQSLARKKDAPAAQSQIASAAASANDLIASRSIVHLTEEETKGPVSARTIKIPALPFTRAEADQILAAAPSRENFEALDFQASRATALDPALGQYRYVHFATHGYLDSERPGLSALLLSMVDENGNRRDGFLRANEIYNLKLSADLVVLSACQTGLGKEIKGEGLVGLTRGFMYAGVPRVVVSLWSVNDRATAELMARFYRKMLKDGQRPAAALRAAQLEMWKTPQWRSPYYWAAFGLQGEWR